jgi:hypothetical protein
MVALGLLPSRQMLQMDCREGVAAQPRLFLALSVSLQEAHPQGASAALRERPVAVFSLDRHLRQARREPHYTPQPEVVAQRQPGLMAIAAAIKLAAVVVGQGRLQQLPLRQMEA